MMTFSYWGHSADYECWQQKFWRPWDRLHSDRMLLWTKLKHHRFQWQHSAPSIISKPSLYTTLTTFCTCLYSWGADIPLIDWPPDRKNEMCPFLGHFSTVVVTSFQFSVSSSPPNGRWGWGVEIFTIFFQVIFQSMCNYGVGISGEASWWSVVCQVLLWSALFSKRVLHSFI